MSILVFTFMSAMFWTGMWIIADSAEAAGFVLRGRRLVSKSAEKLKTVPLSRQVRAFLRSRKKDALTADMLECLAYIRNIAILGRKGSISIESLLTELADFSPGLSRAFAEMAQCIRVGDSERASGCLYKAIGENWAKDIGVLLCGWESMPPQELLQSIEIYKSTVSEMRYTKIRRRDELISDLVYFPVVLNCVVVLLNFLYVAYFLQQKEILSLFF